MPNPKKQRYPIYFFQAIADNLELPSKDPLGILDLLHGKECTIDEDNNEDLEFDEKGWAIIEPEKKYNIHFYWEGIMTIELEGIPGSHILMVIR